MVMSKTLRRVVGGRDPRYPCKRTLSVIFDDETFWEVVARAEREGTSASEQVRLLVTWGLEAATAAVPRARIQPPSLSPANVGEGREPLARPPRRAFTRDSDFTASPENGATANGHATEVRAPDANRGGVGAVDG